MRGTLAQIAITASLPIVVVAFSCSRPKPPTLLPEKATVTALAPTGVTLDVELGVDNPNAIELSGRSVTAKVTLDGAHDLGTVSVPRPFKLPPRQRTQLSVPMTLNWADVSLLVSLAASNRPVSYDVDGTVNLGGDLLDVDLPFHLAGVITQRQLVQATINSIPAFPLR